MNYQQSLQEPYYRPQHISRAPLPSLLGLPPTATIQLICQWWFLSRRLSLPRSPDLLPHHSQNHPSSSHCRKHKLRYRTRQCLSIFSLHLDLCALMSNHVSLKQSFYCYQSQGSDSANFYPSDGYQNSQLTAFIAYTDCRYPIHSSCWQSRSYLPAPDLVWRLRRSRFHQVSCFLLGSEGARLGVVLLPRLAQYFRG